MHARGGVAVAQHAAATRQVKAGNGPQGRNAGKKKVRREVTVRTWNARVTGFQDSKARRGRRGGGHAVK